jgi:hypothetical protein
LEEFQEAIARIIEQWGAKTVSVGRSEVAVVGNSA